MPLARFAGIVAGLFALALGLVAPAALAQSNGPAYAPAPLKSYNAATFKAAGAPATRVRVEAPAAEAIAKVKRENALAHTKELVIGIGRAVDAPAAASDALAWTPAGDGFAARWEVASSDAKALRVALAIHHLEPGSEIRFSGSGDSVVYGPFTANDILTVGGEFWSPVLEGDTARIELFVPATGTAGKTRVAVSTVSHLFVSPADPRAEAIAKQSGFCEVNLICRAAGDQQLAETGRSVARMTFQKNGGTALCTGTLLNPADGSFTPYFYTAAHCISTQGVASTLTTHWFYENTSCSGTTVNHPSYQQVGGGAALLHASTSTDVAFMRLNQSPPAGAVYAGWDAAAVTAGMPVTAIHHPQGDIKKVSLATVTRFEQVTELNANGSFIRVDWNSIATGVTEGGSSGSGIFSGNSGAGYRFRGGLLGGASSCNAAPAQLWDWYSRFDQAYAALAQYLNPASQAPLGPNVLSNPGFENGNSSWASQSSGGFTIITNDSTNAHAGSWFAWMGGENDLTETVHQDLVVPAGGRLQFWYRITTNEFGSTPFDEMRVALLNPATGATIVTLANYSNADATGGWVESPQIDLSAYAGQAVRLQFRVTTDGSIATNFRIDDVSVRGTQASGANNYTALWWRAPANSESGWGVNVTHQGNILFATLFTYDANGQPMWLVMSQGTRQGNGDTFSGALYRTTGPVFNANPFNPAAVNVTQVGTMTFNFTGVDSGTLTYSFNGVTVTKPITRQVYGTRAANCTTTNGSRAGASNYQDLWWRGEVESGWGINITHQDNTLFATLFSYGANGQGMWLVMSNGARQNDGSYFGGLYRVTGPAFNASPWGSVGLTQVGTMRLRFTNGENGTLEYTVDGVSVTKQITRQVFATPMPLCS